MSRSHRIRHERAWDDDNDDYRLESLDSSDLVLDGTGTAIKKHRRREPDDDDDADLTDDHTGDDSGDLPCEDDSRLGWVSRQLDRAPSRQVRARSLDRSGDVESQLVRKNVGLVNAVMRDLGVSDFKRAATYDLGIGKPLHVGPVKTAGIDGLVEAATRFDPSRGVRFSTYAWPRVRGAILNYLDAIQRPEWEPPPRGGVEPEPPPEPEVDPIPTSVATLLEEIADEAGVTLVVPAPVGNPVRVNGRRTVSRGDAERDLREVILRLSTTTRGRHSELATKVIAWRLGYECTQEVIADRHPLMMLPPDDGLVPIAKCRPRVEVERRTGLTPKEVRGLEARAMKVLRTLLARRFQTY
jgi:Sigma-70 region 2